MFLAPSRNIACASTVAVVVPSPATSDVLLAHIGAAVLADRGRADVPADDDVTPFGPERHRDGVGEAVDATQQRPTMRRLCSGLIYLIAQHPACSRSDSGPGSSDEGPWPWSREPDVQCGTDSDRVSCQHRTMNTTQKDQPISCRGCHTVHPSLTQELVDAGDGWLCDRCGQRWDVGRLATVAAYEAWCAVQDGTSAASARQDHAA
jgi:hypothetical protein